MSVAGEPPRKLPASRPVADFDLVPPSPIRYVILVNEDAALVDRLYTDIEWALSQGLPQTDLVFMLERLAKEAPPHTQHYVYAKRQLAELLVRHHPFRAARLAQDVLAQQPDDRASAVLGLSHMILGNYRLAEKAYRQALRMVPHCPWYAHNLGHLLDAALDRPEDALRYLLLARRGLPQEPEIASSYAHALLRAGKPDEAKRQLLIAVDQDHERAAQILDRWTEPSETK